MSRDQEQIYEEYVLYHAEQPYHRGALPEATHRARVENPSCGDSVEISLLVSDDVISEAWQTGSGCLISQAAASMLVEYLAGMEVSVATAMTAEDMLTLFRARLMPRRQQCCLLAWHSLQQALSP